MLHACLNGLSLGQTPTDHGGLELGPQGEHFGWCYPNSFLGFLTKASDHAVLPGCEVTHMDPFAHVELGCER